MIKQSQVQQLCEHEGKEAVSLQSLECSLERQLEAVGAKTRSTSLCKKLKLGSVGTRVVAMVSTGGIHTNSLFRFECQSVPSLVQYACMQSDLMSWKDPDVVGGS